MRRSLERLPHIAGHIDKLRYRITQDEMANQTTGTVSWVLLPITVTTEPQGPHLNDKALVYKTVAKRAFHRRFYCC